MGAVRRNRLDAMETAFGLGKCEQHVSPVGDGIDPLKQLERMVRPAGTEESWIFGNVKRGPEADDGGL